MYYNVFDLNCKLTVNLPHVFSEGFDNIAISPFRTSLEEGHATQFADVFMPEGGINY